MSELIGKVISHYHILEQIGHGGMGVVYKARDTKLDRFVALKFLPQHLRQSEEEKKRFIHEAKAASALDHLNICNIHEIDETGDGQMFIAMACYDGESLKKKIEHRPLPIAEAIDITIQVAEGLTKAHGQNIVHRDIKPGNIIVTNDGVVKIVDFGLAKLAGRTKLTRSGSVMGTTAYMSPEQTQGAVVDHRTDIWALGVILYEMLAGEHPFKGDYDGAVMYSIMNEEPEPLTGLRTGVPMELERILSKALEKDKADRYQHVDEMLTDLRKIERELKGEIKEKRLRLKRRWVVSRPLWIGITLLLGLIAGTLIFLPRESISFGNRDWVLIADFDNTTGNDVFSGALEEALARELSQSRYVNVVPPERKFDALRLMKKSPETPIDAALAPEVALRDGGIRAILGGSIRQIGETYAITAHLIDPKSGTRVISLSEDARGMNDILPAIRRLSDRVRKNLGESLSEIAPPESAGTGEWYEKVTTANLKALQLYRRGYVYVNQFNWKKALLFTQQAIVQDSTFAMAYLLAGFMHSNMGRDAEAKPYFDKALSLSENLTDREKYFIRGGHAYIFGDYEIAIEQYTVLVDLYPDDFWGHMNLFISYAWLQEHQRAFDHLKEAARIRPNDPGSLSMLLLFELSIFENLETAQKYYQQIAQIAPDFDFASYQIFKPMQLWIKGDLEGAKRELQTALERARGLSNWTQWAIKMTLANFETYKGEFQQALELTQKTAEFGQERNAPILEGEVLCQKGLLLRELGDYEQFDLEFRSLLRKFPESVASGAAAWLAYQQAQTGQTTETRRLLLQIESGAMNQREKQAFVHLIEGQLAQSAGKYEKAIEHFQQARQLVTAVAHPPPHFYHPLLADLALAEAYEQNHQVDAAIKIRQNIIHHKMKLFWPGFVMGAFEWVKAYYHLGRLYEQKGDVGKAVEYYRKFLECWNKADRPLPEIQKAKDRLAQLSEVK